MSPFETITHTDGEEEIKKSVEKSAESLSNIEKMNVRRFWGYFAEGIVGLGESINNLDDSKKFDKNYLSHSVFPKIQNLITRYHSEDSLESKNKNKQRDLSGYDEFKQNLDVLAEGLDRFREEVQAQAITGGISKEEIEDKYGLFVRNPLPKLHDSVDAIAPETQK